MSRKSELHRLALMLSLAIDRTRVESSSSPSAAIVSCLLRLYAEAVDGDLDVDGRMEMMNTTMERSNILAFAYCTIDRPTHEEQTLRRAVPAAIFSSIAPIVVVILVAVGAGPAADSLASDKGYTGYATSTTHLELARD